MTTHVDRDRTAPDEEVEAAAGSAGSEGEQAEPGEAPAPRRPSTPSGSPARRPGTAGPKAVATPTPRPRSSGGQPKPAARAASAAAPTRPEPPASSPSAGRARLPWILAVVGLIGTLTFGVAWNHERTRPAATSSVTTEAHDVRAAAVDFSKALTNFDGSSIDHDFDRLLGLSTGGFHDQADQFFSAKTRVALKEAQASSRGEVRQAFVQSASADEGSVFVVVDQTIANNKSPQPQADTLRMELTLQLKGGRWLVDQVDVLTAPGQSTTLTPSGTGTHTGG